MNLKEKKKMKKQNILFNLLLEELLRAQKKQLKMLLFKKIEDSFERKDARGFTIQIS